MKTKYSDLIEIRESAIAFKIQPENGDWRDFIPNEQFNEVLRKVVNSVYNNNADFHKPFWISGTYGSGKSHAGAVIKHLLCDPIDDINDYIKEEYSKSEDSFKEIQDANLNLDLLNLRISLEQAKKANNQEEIKNYAEKLIKIEPINKAASESLLNIYISEKEWEKAYKILTVGLKSKIFNQDKMKNQILEKNI